MDHVVDFPPSKRVKVSADSSHEEKEDDANGGIISQKLRLLFKINKLFSYISDISRDQEKFPIPCANWIDSDPLPSFNYISRYITDNSVTMTTDNGFMIRCTCNDSCKSSETCSCRQLTLYEGRGVSNLSQAAPIGYNDFKLDKALISGLYECNQYCSCSSQCSNRLVQFGVQHKLLVYKTEKMGWGVMCLEDIAKGSFVCCYVGEICTDEIADSRGLRYGDNYLAELDYIEIAEQAKEGYESDFDISTQLSSSISSHDSDHELSSTSKVLIQKEREEDKEVTSSGSQEIDLTDNEIKESEKKGEETVKGQYSCSVATDDYSFYLISRDTPPLSSPSSLSPSLTDKSNSSSYESSSCRWYYHEKCSYVVDANTSGNVARFLNHSCSPNLFVQNIFVNSHDLRFPWIAFFAKKDIPAYSQLCWDYNYVIGSVEGKEITCHCEAINCRKRLL